MKKRLTLTLFAAIVATLAGCGTTSSEAPASSETPTTSEAPATSETPTTSEEPVTSEEVPTSELTSQEKLDIINEVVTTVPLAVESGTGTVLYTDRLTELKDGRDLLAVKQVSYWGSEINVTWTYREGNDGGGNPLATFEVKSFDELRNQIRPGYPEYDLLIDGAGNDISVVPPIKSGQLRATLTLDGVSKTVNFNAWLYPQMKINWKPLDTIRDSKAAEIVGARGYITSIYPNYNAISIQDGDYALTLFKVQAYANAGFKIGDYVEAAGSWAPYNGLAEIGYIKRFNKVDPAEFNAQLPTVHEITPADFQEWYDAVEPADQFMTALYDMDSALIKIDEPMTILRAENREAQEIAFTDLPVGNTHANIILGAEVGGRTVEIKLSLSYHIGTVVQQEIKTMMINAGKGALVKYEGILNWFNEPVLGPMTAADIILVD